MGKDRIILRLPGEPEGIEVEYLPAGSWYRGTRPGISRNGSTGLLEGDGTLATEIKHPDLLLKFPLPGSKRVA